MMMVIQIGLYVSFYHISCTSFIYKRCIKALQQQQLQQDERTAWICKDDGFE
jgi:hypothetical protein